MNLKEITVKEALKKLYEEGEFEGYVRDSEYKDWTKGTITGIDLDERYKEKPFISKFGDYKYCAIEVTAEYEPYPDDVCPDLKCGDVIVEKDKKIEHLIMSFDKTNAYGCFVFSDCGWKDNKCLFKYYTKLDGSPIGRIKEKK